MKGFKKPLRLLGLTALIILATLGVAIGGGVPISSNKKAENSNEIKIELVENVDDKARFSETKERE